MGRLYRKQADLLKPDHAAMYTIQVEGGVRMGRHRVPVQFTSKHWQWGHLIDPSHVSEGTITIPGSQFHDDKRVKDICRAVWQDGQVVDTQWRHRTGRGGIVVILESPHKDEYTKDESFEPLIPLNGTRSVQRFFLHLGEILGAIARQGVTIPNGDVVLCNPVQWQTSLHRLTQTHFLVSEIRDVVWSRIYAIGAVQAFFEARLKSYQPRLIINACTGSLDHPGPKQAVQQTLTRLWEKGDLEAALAATHHPSVWMERTAAHTVVLRPARDKQ